MEVASMLVTICGYVFTVALFIYNLFNKAKYKKSSSEREIENCELREDVIINEILGKIPSYVTEAEKVFGDGNGVAKKMYVIMKIQCECYANNLSIEESLISSKIEEVLTAPHKKEI